MARYLNITAAQAAPQLITDPPSTFRAAAAGAMIAYPDTDLLVFPELQLFADGEPDRSRTEALDTAAEPLDGPRVRGLAQIAADLGVWLVPGSVCERGENGELFNTALLLSPNGELAASYRKIFPWRPHEPYTPGSGFTVAQLPGIGRIGLNICYDAWFPEVSRQLAWMGAELIVNVVKTTTEDRAQEVILAQANAIVNQVFMVSVNCAAPVGKGESLIVGPEGAVVSCADGAEPELLHARLDLDDVTRVREHGTAGVNRPWSQFHPGEPPIQLPVYGGAIDPTTWTPEAQR